MWVTILAQKDAEGLVHNTVAGLGKDAELTYDEARAAIHVLESPDPKSTSKDEEGRRIKPVEGGWIVVNHWKYRDEMQKIRQENARRQREKRARDRAALKKQYPPASYPTMAERVAVKEMEDAEI